MSAGLLARVWGPRGLRLAAMDALIVAALVAASLASLALPVRTGGASARAEVLVGGRPAASLALSRDGVTAVRGPLGETRVEVRGGRARIVSSPCPQQLCRGQGWAEAAGPPLVCAPNGVLVRLDGARAGDVDAVTR